MGWEEVKREIEHIRLKGGEIVFTNGVFDILHRGHVEYLTYARSLGDTLVVGINTDDSVRRIKGPARPINTLEDRIFVLRHLDIVDFVVPFDEDTPLELIKFLEPDILVKGADYELDEIVGREIVEQRGGKVVRAPLKEGYSTTKLIKKIVEMSKELGVDKMELRTPFVAVDAIIQIFEGDQFKGIVLIERKYPPYGYALPGGFVEYGESVEHAVVREAKEETGLDVHNVRQFKVYSDPSRDPRRHTLSVVFTCEAEGTPIGKDDARWAHVFKLEDIPLEKLAFDHKKIILDFIKKSAF